mgnify:CR=1 FL=1
MTPEIMNWLHIKEVYEAELRTSPTATGVFDPNTEKGIKRWADLKKRVVEHVCDKIQNEKFAKYFKLTLH